MAMGPVRMGLSSLAPQPLLPTQAGMLSNPQVFPRPFSSPGESKGWGAARSAQPGARQDEGDPLTPKRGAEKEGRTN